MGKDFHLQNKAVTTTNACYLLPDRKTGGPLDSGIYFGDQGERDAEHVCPSALSSAETRNTDCHNYPKEDR